MNKFYYCYFENKKCVEFFKQYIELYNIDMSIIEEQDHHLIFVSDESLEIDLRLNINMLMNDLNTKLFVISSHKVNDVLFEVVNNFINLHLSSFYTLYDAIMVLYLNKIFTVNNYIIKEFSHLDKELIDSAKAYIYSELNVVKASELLYIHRNTMNYRLDKFIEKTGLNIKKHSDSNYFLLYLRLEDICA